MQPVLDDLAFVDSNRFPKTGRDGFPEVTTIAARKSNKVDSAPGEGIGLDTQDEKSRAFADRLGMTVVGVARDSISGRLAPIDRPELGAWLCDPAKRALFDVVIAYRRKLSATPSGIRRSLNSATRPRSFTRSIPVSRSATVPTQLRRCVGQYDNFGAEVEDTICAWPYPDGRAARRDHREITWSSGVPALLLA
jgi:hypothetical protein